MYIIDLISQKIFEKMESELERKYKIGEYTAPPKGSPIEIDKNSKLNFVVFGDSQVSNYMYARECSFRLGCLDIANMKDKLDAIVICGDIAENGFRCEYRMTAKLLNEISDKFDTFVGMVGNHDIRFRNYKKQMTRFNEFLGSVKGGIRLNGSYHYSALINGYKFIVMGADRNSFESAYISKKQLEWLDKELADAQKDDKPVFVFNHQTLKNTNGLPHTWLGKGNWRGHVGKQSDQIKAIFEKYNHTFFITGHLHWGTNKYSFEDYGSYKALSVPTISAGNHGDYSPDAQGYVVSVYDDKVVLRARVFGEGRYVEDSIPNHEVVVKL